MQGHSSALPRAVRGVSADAGVARHAAVRRGSGQPAAFQGLAGRAVGQRPAIEVDLDFAALEVPADELLGQRILDIALNRAAEGPRAVRPVLARLLDDPVDDLGRELEPDLAVDEVVVQLLDEQVGDRPEVVVRERLEDDDLVDAVDELGVEGLADLARAPCR